MQLFFHIASFPCNSSVPVSFRFVSHDFATFHQQRSETIKWKISFSFFF